MEFHEKLQTLRKQKGVTQEELANALFVSRTAVSKWESGRGYPNLDSLQQIAKFFCVSIDDLLSSGEALTIAQEDHRQKALHSRDLVFGLLDISAAILFIAPFFGQGADGHVQAVSLLSLTEITPYLKAAYLAAVAGMVLFGIAALTLQNHRGSLWLRIKTNASLLLNGICALVFILSPQPYAAVFVLSFLTIKGILLRKCP